MDIINIRNYCLTKNLKTMLIENIKIGETYDALIYGKVKVYSIYVLPTERAEKLKTKALFNCFVFATNRSSVLSLENFLKPEA